MPQQAQASIRCVRPSLTACLPACMHACLFSRGAVSIPSTVLPRNTPACTGGFCGFTPSSIKIRWALDCAALITGPGLGWAGQCLPVSLWCRMVQFVHSTPGSKAACCLFTKTHPLLPCA